jgi:hypothetical protein
MFNKLLKKLLIGGLFLLSLNQSVVSQAAGSQSDLSIDQVIASLEKKYPVHIFYKTEWFSDRVFYPAILKLSLNESLERISAETDLSVVRLDSSLYIFVPLKPVPKAALPLKVTDVIIVGNPDDYGKYTKANIQGKILDGLKRSPLAGASIFIDKLKLGATADKDGKYMLHAPVGEHIVRLSFMGYDETIQKISLVGDGTLNLDLFEKSIHLGEVIVSSERPELNVTGTQMSYIKLDYKSIRELPFNMGMTDIIKSITLMPGVQTVGEFGTGFNVRGGSADQNLILLEDVPLFNSSHLFGLTSVVNSDGISNVILLKAGISAKYGERASSVMDIRMGAGDINKTSLKGGIGLIDSRLYLETPLINKKISLLVSARSSYSNWLLHSVPDLDLMNSSARFYDVNTFLTYNLNSNNKINLFGYFSKDQFGFSRNTDYQYSNLLASIRWKHTFSKILYFNLVAGLSNYRYNVAESDTSRPLEAYEIKSDLNYRNVKLNFSWVPFENHNLDFGLNSAFYAIQPGELFPLKIETIINARKINPEKAGEYAIYITDNVKLSRKITLDLGLRYSYYSYLGPNKVYVYNQDLPKSNESIIDSALYGNNKLICSFSGLEPRISLRIGISEIKSVKFSYNRIHQYINLVSNTAVMTPSDVWKLSTPNLKPLVCDHMAIGYFQNFKNNTIETSVEIYYKILNNAIDYKNGAKILLNPSIESDLVNARGKNYGIELYIKRNSGKLTGWASYTFSRSWLKTRGYFSEEKINNNHPFPSGFDRPHNLVINSSYHFSRRWRLGTTFTYSSGRPVTLPEYKFLYQTYELLYYSDRNKYRLPDYHRLDVSITLDESLRVRKMWKGSWTFSIINLYGRKNAYSVFYKKEDNMVANQFRQYNTFMLYIIGRPLPTLTYNFTF